MDQHAGPDGATRSIDPSAVCWVFWTRWKVHPGVARAVVGECFTFAVEALGGRPPECVVIVKTPGKGTFRPEDLAREENEWRDAVEHQAAQSGGDTEFEFQYIPASQPVTSAWHLGFGVSRFWERAEILAFPAMDFIDARLQPPFQLTPLDRVGDEVAASVRNAAKCFGDMLKRVRESRGLAVGGFKTRETSVASDPERDARRRGGQAAKDLVENAIRCYASGMFDTFDAFQRLLAAHPDLRVRSEILVAHREYWLKLMAHDMLRLEPWEATIQLILSALIVGSPVDQIDFQWLVEDGGKPDTVIVEQLRRGIHCIDRLAVSLKWRDAGT
jgi:hypothetical protein